MNNEKMLLRLIYLSVTLLLFSFNSSADFFKGNYSIVIGIGDYPSKPWKKLPYANKDAKDMCNFLKSQGYSVMEIYDKEATKAGIIAGMQNLARKVTGTDRVLIFFSGHGYTETYGGEDYGYLVPYDGTESSATYISMEEFRGLADKMKNARHQLFIVDACYGGLLQTKDIGFKTNIPDYRREPKYLDEATKRPARQILMAGGKDQQVLAGSIGKNSFFTYRLLEALGKGLADVNGDGFITFSELCGYIVPRATNTYQTPAWGTLPGHGLGEYVFTTMSSAGIGITVPDSLVSTEMQLKGNSMIYIDSGSFTMGSDRGDKDERPVHLVKVDAFYIEATEVTNRQYDECVKAGVCSPASYNDGMAFTYKDGSWSKGVIPDEFRVLSNPVVAVTWEQANRYCNWIGGRLPSEEEWEFAACGGSHTDYFWDNDKKNACLYGNFADSMMRIQDTSMDIVQCKDNYTFTSPVGTYEPNWYGLYDMLGNVWEWCDGWYRSYPIDGKRTSPVNGGYRVIRGGAWCDSEKQIRTSNRRWIDSGNRNCSVGFRCVRSEK